MAVPEPRPSAVPAENVLPGATQASLLLQIDEQTSVGVTGVRSYPNGFSLELWLFSVGRPPGRRGAVAPPEPAQLRVRYADGRTGQTTVPPVPRPAPMSGSPADEILVLPLRSHLGPGPMRQDVWISPLPSEGVVEVSLTTLPGQLLAAGELSGDEIRRAADRSVEVWPAAPPAAPVFDAELAPPLPAAGTAPVDAAAAAEAIRSAFRAAFDRSNGDERFEVVQDGPVLRGAAEEAGRRWPEVAASIRVAVGEIVFLDELRAAVQYQLSWAGPGGVGPQLGYAVRERGTWKVARGTYCRLLDAAGVQYPPPPPVL